MPNSEQAKFVAEGKAFRKKVEPGRKDSPPQERKVRIVGSVDQETGDIRFRPAHELSITPSDLPHFDILQVEESVDKAEVARSLDTARKQAGGASTAGVNMEKIYLERGAKNARLPKTGGFGSKVEQRKIAEIRKQKGSAVDRDEFDQS